MPARLQPSCLDQKSLDRPARKKNRVLFFGHDQGVRFFGHDHTVLFFGHLTRAGLPADLRQNFKMHFIIENALYNCERLHFIIDFAQIKKTACAVLFSGVFSAICFQVPSGYPLPFSASFSHVPDSQSVLHSVPAFS